MVLSNGMRVLDVVQIEDGNIPIAGRGLRQVDILETFYTPDHHVMVTAGGDGRYGAASPGIATLAGSHQFLLFPLRSRFLPRRSQQTGTQLHRGGATEVR